MRDGNDSSGREDRGSSWGINRMQSPRKSTVGKYLFGYFSSAVMGGGKKIVGKICSRQTDRQSVIFLSRYELSTKAQTARQLCLESSIGEIRARR